MAIVSAYILKTAMHWIVSAYIFFWHKNKQKKCYCLLVNRPQNVVYAKGQTTINRNRSLQELFIDVSIGETQIHVPMRNKLQFSGVHVIADVTSILSISVASPPHAPILNMSTIAIRMSNSKFLMRIAEQQSFLNVTLLDFLLTLEISYA